MERGSAHANLWHWLANRQGDLAKVYCSRSTDDGVNWSASALLDPSGLGTPGRDFDPVIESNGVGTWIAVWAVGWIRRIRCSR
jgi:hypothetical protein